MENQTLLLPSASQLRNMAIEEAYFKTIQEIAELSKSFPNPKLRIRIEIDLKHCLGKDNEIFELLTPYVYLLLTRNDAGELKIGYAVNDCSVGYLGQLYFTKLIRIIYSHTIHSKTGEECLEVFPYHSEIYEEARHFASDFEEEYPHYKFIQEEFKGQ